MSDFHFSTTNVTNTLFYNVVNVPWITFVQFDLVLAKCVHGLFTDDNECERQPCWINSVCDNTDGSYNCVCRPGYSAGQQECNGKRST